MYNTIVTVCHLVSDPELKEISGGKKVFYYFSLFIYAGRRRES